jgi:hypothetical protein
MSRRNVPHFLYALNQPNEKYVNDLFLCNSYYRKAYYKVCKIGKFASGVQVCLYL